MSLIPRIPVWKEMENWRARQEAMRSYMDSLSAMSDTLSGAGADQANGLAELSAKAAAKRIQSEAAAKSAKYAADSAQSAADDKAMDRLKDLMADYVNNNKLNVIA
jgi:hypothetical protein